MPEIGVTAEGKAYLLDVIFRGKEPARELWVGVARRSLGHPGLASLTATEPEAGYARQSVLPMDWERDGEGSIVARGVQFENRGPDVWPYVEVAFIATSRDEGGELLAWTPLDRPRQLLPGDTLQVFMRLSL